MSILKILSNQESLITPTITAETHWAAHVPFVRWLVSEVKPKTFVELGTENGHSFFNIAESMHKMNPQSKCFAVDNWLGDEFTSEYSEDVYNGVVEINQEIFQNQNVLLRMQFDSALNRFEDKSIDLLHIDGSHRYQDIKNDFQKWMSKVSEDGIILIHDIQVRDSQFGVYDFWQEITKAFSHIEFFHGFGLGVVFVGEKTHRKLVQDYDIESKEFVGFFEVLGSKYLKNLERINFQLTNSPGSEIQSLRKSNLILLEELKSVKISLESENKSLEKSNRTLIEELNSVKNSRIWKVTLPYRQFKDKVKWNFQYLLQNPFFKSESNRLKDGMFELEKCKSKNAKIAVIFHAYYPDEIPEVMRNLACINVPFDLYVSSYQLMNDSIFSELDQIEQIKIDYFENKGRDILPFILMFQKYDFYGYQAILKVHTKKSHWLDANYSNPLGMSRGKFWKNKLLTDLLGSERNFLEISNIFQNNHRIDHFTKFYYSSKKESR